MTSLLFDPPPVRSIPVRGSDRRYPVHRVFCVGRNYAAHAAEMGVAVDREAPFYFTKSTYAVLESGSTLPYPPGTSDFHHEVELFVALGAPAFRVSAAQAEACIFGYGCGLDMTRRDLQAIAKDKRRPWDLSKNVEGSAVLAPITRAGEFGPIGNQRIHLSVNDRIRQDSHLSDMVHSIPDIIADLSKFYHLGAGDIIMTGTPEGVGPVVAGDRINGGIDGLDPVSLQIGAPQ